MWLRISWIKFGRWWLNILSLKAVIPGPVRIETIPWARTLAPRGEDGPRGQFFKQIFAPTEKFAPTQYSAHAIVRAYASFKKLASGANPTITSYKTWSHSYKFWIYNYNAGVVVG
jgi:hypothetical protein